MITLLIILALLLILIGEFTMLLWILAPVAAVWLFYVIYAAVRMGADPEYREQAEQEIEQAKSRRKVPSGPGPYSLAARREKAGRRHRR